MGDDDAEQQAPAKRPSDASSSRRVKRPMLVLPRSAPARGRSPCRRTTPACARRGRARAGRHLGAPSPRRRASPFISRTPLRAWCQGQVGRGADSAPGEAAAGGGRGPRVAAPARAVLPSMVSRAWKTTIRLSVTWGLPAAAGGPASSPWRSSRSGSGPPTRRRSPAPRVGGELADERPLGRQQGEGDERAKSRRRSVRWHRPRGGCWRLSKAMPPASHPERCYSRAHRDRQAPREWVRAPVGRHRRRRGRRPAALRGPLRCPSATSGATTQTYYLPASHEIARALSTASCRC
jgi:hypothetical protein